MKKLILKKSIIAVLFFFISFNNFSQEVSLMFNTISYNNGVDSTIWEDHLPGPLYMWYEDGNLIQEWPGELVYYPVELLRESDNAIYFNSQEVSFKQGVKFVDYIYDKKEKSVLINTTFENENRYKETIKFHLTDLGY